MIVTNIRIKGMSLFCKTCTMIKCSGIASQRTSCWTAKATSASQISVSPLNIICDLSNLYFDEKFNIISSYMNMNICMIYHILIDIFPGLAVEIPEGEAVRGRVGTVGDIYICILWHLYLYCMAFVFVFCDIFFCILWHLYWYFMTFVFSCYDVCICIIFYNICLCVLFYDIIIITGGIHGSRDNWQWEVHIQVRIKRLFMFSYAARCFIDCLCHHL